VRRHQLDVAGLDVPESLDVGEVFVRDWRESERRSYRASVFEPKNSAS